MSLDTSINHSLYKDSICSLYRRTQLQNYFLALSDFINQKLKYNTSLNTSRSESYRISLDWIRENINLYQSIYQNQNSYFNTLDIQDITVDKISFYMLQSCRPSDRDRISRHAFPTTLKLFVGYLVFHLIEELVSQNLLDRNRLAWR